MVKRKAENEAGDQIEDKSLKDGTPNSRLSKRVVKRGKVWSLQPPTSIQGDTRKKKETIASDVLKDKNKKRKRKEIETQGTADGVSEPKKEKKTKKTDVKEKGAEPEIAQAKEQSHAVEAIQSQENADVSTKEQAVDPPASEEAVTADNEAKTLYVGNLPYDTKEKHVKKFFKDVGNIVDVRLKRNDNGTFRGFAHVEFATRVDAEKGLKKNGEICRRREVKLDYICTSDIRYESSSYKMGASEEGSAVVVSGFNGTQGPIEIESSIQRYFKDCGTIIWLRSVPRDNPTRVHVTFKELDGAKKAVKVPESCPSLFTVEIVQENPHLRGCGRDQYRGRGGRGFKARV